MCNIALYMVDVNRKSLNVTVPLDVYNWLDKMIKEHEFASLSHGVTLALTRLKKEREGEQPPR